MAKRFRLRLSRVIPSFQSCRSKDDAGVTVTNAAFRLCPVNRKAFDIDFPPPPTPGPSPSFLRRPHPPVVSGLACGCLPSRRGCHFFPADDGETPPYLWRKEEKWPVVAYADGDAGDRYDFPSSPRRKIDSDDGCDILLPAAMAKARRREAKLRRRRRRGETKRSSRSRARVSTSSAVSGWFSSEGDGENDEREGDFFDEEEDDGETEKLVSSTDCSSHNVLQRRRITRRRRRRLVKCYPSPERTAAAVLRSLVPCGAAATAAAEGKVRESFAVVKRSEDPRADFRRSMAEMVVEKEIYDAGDLEQLLLCFLSLNSRHHHRAIVAAFSDIWEALFPVTATAAAAPAVSKN
ncbi:transcription repressor OFP7-like [Phoenix dactylifera]|uniref:Transcription repressor n=1 Tax=Phoenix dactylifera TaxID=42345 RepID=A0A8B8ZSU9_PHODC|nr:transcription repressor OFP7-like [Phoenix dactylifera]